QLDAAFKEAAFKLEQDEISDPVESQFGFHIIKVTDKPTKEPFEDVKADYEKELKLSKIDGTVMQEALKDVLEKADVKIADKDLEDTFDTFLGKEEEKEDTDSAFSLSINNMNSRLSTVSFNVSKSN